MWSDSSSVRAQWPVHAKVGLGSWALANFSTRKLRGTVGWAVAFCLTLAFVPIGFGQEAEEEQPDPIKWQHGPIRVPVGSMAEIDVPEGFVFVGSSETIRLLELMGNPTNGSELGTIAPVDADWYLFFEFDNIGYVKDDERDELEADAILDSIRQGTEASNKIRKERGWPTMQILGWEEKPHYDSVTNNLVWAIQGEAEGHISINYDTRWLGRTGVMNVGLVCDPEDLSAAVVEMNKVLQGFEFVAGKRYAEFKPGDKIAEYGLTALITGGAAAVALKSGLFKWLWKLIVVGIVAIGGIFKAIFGRKEAA